MCKPCLFPDGLNEESTNFVPPVLLERKLMSVADCDQLQYPIDPKLAKSILCDFGISDGRPRGKLAGNFTDLRLAL